MSNYGIDLGTTNSSIALLSGSRVRVFKDNHMGLEYTPSAVYMSRENTLIVGHEAKLRAFLEPDNGTIEFKRHMGASSPFTFKRTGLTMQPEDLSAEVLKVLNAHVVRAGGQPVVNAVITVPADFDQPQCEATMKAASLAGIKNCLLLTEPVAAAQSYSFDSEEDKTFWLVYDLGGGTFDAAVIQVRDGLIKVVGHGGDNRLGGAEIDTAIVNELLIPALPLAFSQKDKDAIRERDATWLGAWTKLKGAAEAAKIALSNPDITSYDIVIEYLTKDSKGEPVEFNYKLTRDELDKLATPIILRTINKIKEVLTSARLKPSDISKMILVGGPTMMPITRTLLGSLGISLEFGVDPLTVVSQGAAIFAASQFGDVADAGEVAEGGFGAKLAYDPVTAETDPEVAGTFVPYDGSPMDFTGYTVEIMNESLQPSWRSGRIGLSPKGSFSIVLEAQKRCQNHFTLELCDAQGVIQQVEPSSFDIVVSGSGIIGDPVHSHDIGIALADDSFLVLYSKNTPLPFRKTNRDLKTTVTVRKGSNDRMIRVPVCEGAKARASRNRLIGLLEIPSEKIPRDLPHGTEVELTLEMDVNKKITTIAFIPSIELEIEQVLALQVDTPDVDKLRNQVTEANSRLTRLRQEADNEGNPSIIRLFQPIDEGQLHIRVKDLAAAAGNDPGSARQCVNVLNELNSALDDIQDAMQWPILEKEAQAALEKTREVVMTDKYAAEADRRLFEMILPDFNDALANRDVTQLKRAMLALDLVKDEIYRRDPGAWVGAFETAKRKRDQMSDRAQADRLVDEGDRAIMNNDVTGLQQATYGLWRLLPEEEVEAVGTGSTVGIV